MAKNFRIFLHKTQDSLHMKLSGDFDGSSAAELIHVLRNHRTPYYQVFINTRELSAIHPFGMDVFQKQFSELQQGGPAVRFIGKDIGQTLH
jgi:hypothetical protein